MVGWVSPRPPPPSHKHEKKLAGCWGWGGGALSLSHTIVCMYIVYAVCIHAQPQDTTFLIHFPMPNVQYRDCQPKKIQYILKKTSEKSMNIIIIYLLNGLFHEMDLAFDDMYGSFRPNQKTGSFFKILGAPMVLYCKSVFLAVNGNLSLLKY
jgi:hypothetical protein